MELTPIYITETNGMIYKYQVSENDLIKIYKAFEEKEEFIKFTDVNKNAEKGEKVKIIFLRISKIEKLVVIL